MSKINLIQHKNNNKQKNKTMKKTFIYIAVIVFSISVFVGCSQTSNSEKHAKESAKNWAKKGWKLIGSQQSMEDTFIAYSEELDRTDGEEISSMIVTCSDAEKCLQMALAGAVLQISIIYYAEENPFEYISDLCLTYNDESCLELFFEMLQKTEIPNFFQPNFSLVNEKTSEYISFFILTEKIENMIIQELDKIINLINTK
jgi:hypothetical protein